MVEETKKRTVEMTIGGKLRSFDIDDPVLPDWVEKRNSPPATFPTTRK